MKKISSFLALFLLSLGMMAQTPMEKVKVTLTHDKTTSVLGEDGNPVTGATAEFQTDAISNDEKFPVDQNLFLSDQPTHKQAEYYSQMSLTMPSDYSVSIVKLRLNGCWGDQWGPGKSYVNAMVTLNDGAKDLYTVKANEVQINGAGGVILPLEMDKTYNFAKGQKIVFKISLTGIQKGQNVVYGYNEINIVPTMPSDADKLQMYLESNPASSKQWGNNRNFVVYNDALAQNPKNVAEFEAYINAHCKDIKGSTIYSLRNIQFAGMTGGNALVSVDGQGNVTRVPHSDRYDDPVPMNNMNSLFNIDPYYDGKHYFIKNLNSGLRLTVNADNTCSWTKDGTMVAFEPANGNFLYMTCEYGKVCLKKINNDKFEFICDAAQTGNSAKWLLESYFCANLDFTAAEGVEGAEGWCSAYFPFAIQANEGTNVTSYGVARTDEASKTAVMKEMDGVQKNQGAILKAPKAGTYKFNIGEFAKTTAPAFTNLLTGTTSAKDVASDNNNTYYVFGLKDAASTTVGFYKSNSTTMKANKAYLSLAKTTATNGFDLSFDEVTGVENVEVVNPSEEANGVYYDLSGRRVLNPSNGVYIKNGKKVYVK